MGIHRDSVHTDHFNISTLPTHIGCISLCSSTPDCNFVTYAYDTSTCRRHKQLQGKQVQTSNRVWKREADCQSPFSYNTEIGLCVLFSEVKRNWTDAKANCESRDSRLIVADTDTKFHGVQSSYKDYWLIWIGGFPRTSDGEWVWLTEQLVNMSKFHVGQPSGGKGRLAFWKDGGVLLLDDTFPHERHHYICELV
ncbi:lithostathine-1-alpha-like [Ylistrum balloti]|uniref:lithostathine-1-alpha-like n=1 Tax=Ylistrum balloti TaxID=509963 RepID=UPI002905AC6E|nr:lithostathine-1-alpha-like [Ylistrum balloti]